jgi:hypothetical protein
LLTAIKDVVTSRVAAMLMGMMYGTKVSFAGGNGMAGAPLGAVTQQVVGAVHVNGSAKEFAEAVHPVITL